MKNIIHILLFLILSGCVSQKVREPSFNSVLLNNVQTFASVRNTDIGRIGAIFKELIIIIKDNEDIDFLSDAEDCYMFFLETNKISEGYGTFATTEDIFIVDVFYDEYIIYDTTTNFDFSGFPYRFSYIAQEFMKKISEIEYDGFLKETTK